MYASVGVVLFMQGGVGCETGCKKGKWKTCCACSLQTPAAVVALLISCWHALVLYCIIKSTHFFRLSSRGLLWCILCFTPAPGRLLIDTPPLPPNTHPSTTTITHNSLVAPIPRINLNTTPTNPHPPKPTHTRTGRCEPGAPPGWWQWQWVPRGAGAGGLLHLQIRHGAGSSHKGGKGGCECVGVCGGPVVLCTCVCSLICMPPYMRVQVQLVDGLCTTHTAHPWDSNTCCKQTGLQQQLT